MHPYRQILARMRLGDSDRRLARSGSLDRHRIAALRRIAEGAGWLDLGSPLPEDSVLLAGLQERYSPQAGDVGAERPSPAASQWHQPALVNLHSSQFAADEVWYRQAIEADQRSGDRIQLAKHLATLAALLRSQTGRLEEAQQLAEAAVSISRTFDPATPQPWQSYGVLADILAARAAADSDHRRRAEFLTRARDYQQLCHFAPRFLGALAHFGAEAGYARAVVLGRLARCFYMSGHNAQAIAHLSEALTVIEGLAPSEGLSALRGTLSSELGEIFLATRQHERARQAFCTALRTAEELQDVRAQGVSLSQLGTLSLAAGNTAEALDRCRDALALLRLIREPEVEAAAWHQLGAVFHELQQWQQAERHYREAARIREQYGHLRAAQQSWNQLSLLDCQRRGTETAEAYGRAIASTPNKSPTAATTSNADTESGNRAELPFHITVDEERITDYGLDGDLLIDGPRERRIISWTGAPQSLSADLCPMLAPCVRVSMDTEGAIRFCLPLEEPVFERHRGCTVIRRQRRQISISGVAPILWRLICAIDGIRSVARVLAEVPPCDRAMAARVLGALAANHAIDISGRPIGRFLHSATKKGVMPAGGLADEEVLRFVTDGDHRVYPGASRIDLSQSVPDRLRGLYALTRARRSRRDFNGLSLSRSDFDALLHTACGTTGAMKWAEREVKLRAYPSSGGLYAVEVYAVVLRVEDLSPGIYHYRSDENCLELVKQDIDRNRFLEAMLPTERAMVAGVAAMFCLTGRFARHERKYGEGGYRMLVAETGHISQNLILTAVALGLSARPFGGVFDALLNRDLGLDDGDEQFLLSVLVGHAPVPAGA
jgi:SagB-type dehydrogenase family enzyme